MKNNLRPTELLKKTKMLNQRNILTRRSILKNTFLSASFLSFAGCGGSSSTSAPIISNPELQTPGELVANQTSKSILIIGAGISGLVAAFELLRAGHQVVILEARERRNGRVNTLKALFSDQQFAEAGASRIPSNHHLTLDYCEYFNLALEPFYADFDQYFQINNNNIDLINASNCLNSPPWPGSVNRSEYQKISGGMSNLPRAFADNLGANIIFSQEVESVVQKENEVEIITSDGNFYTADRVLCTVPLTVLAKINFSPSLSSQKIEASSGGYHYTDSSRLFTQFNQRFWRNDQLNGWGETDIPEEIWQPTWSDAGVGGIIQSYLRGEPAKQFDLMTTEMQQESVHARWRKAMPELDSFVFSSHSHSWAKEAWSGSAYASPTNEQNSRLAAHIGLAEGRVHFAGEHASAFHGWIQGALESGIRASLELHTAT